jgi:hypothetical protein
MSEAITLTDFAATFVGKVSAVDLPDMHPAGAVTVGEWLEEMRFAADSGRADLVVKLAQMVDARVALERQWEIENLQTIEGLRHVG